MSVVIREAMPEDSREIARVQVDTWRATYRTIVPQSYLDEMDYNVYAEWWRQQLTTGSSRTYVAERSGAVCGFISGGRLREPLAAFDGEIYALYVEPEAQRCGGGRAMMRELAAALLQDGLTSGVVWVLERNPACRFYARLSGELVGRQTIRIGDEELVEVAYGWKDLWVLAEGSVC